MFVILIGQEVLWGDFKARLVNKGDKKGATCVCRRWFCQLPGVSLLSVIDGALLLSLNLQLEAHAHLVSSGVEVFGIDKSRQSEFHTCGTERVQTLIIIYKN